MLISLSKIFLRHLKVRSVLLTSERTLETVTKLKMDSPTDRVYIRCKGESKYFQVDFLYYDEKEQKKKYLTFNRRTDESVKTLLHRIALKAEGKDKKSLKKKNLHPGSREEESRILINVELVENGTSVESSKSCKEIFFDKAETNNDYLLRIGHRDYPVAVNYPWIHNIALTKLSMIGYFMYPHKFDTLFCNNEETEFRWYRLPSLIGEPTFLISSSSVYTPVAQDLNCKIKLVCVPKKNGFIGPETEVVSDSVVQTGPEFCPFQERHLYTRNKLFNNSFRVVTYNILADMYAESEAGRNVMYKHCSQDHLSIHYRKLLILKELIGYNADLVVLQEVDMDVYERDLKYVLGDKGMDGIISKKGGNTREGVAVFYDRNRFRVISAETYNLGTDSKNFDCVSDIWKIISKNEMLVSRFTDRTTVFQLILLEDIHNGRTIIVGNTHLYFHPDADHIRLLQAGIISRIVNEVLITVKSMNENKDVGILLCGDFNSTPDCGVYKLFTQNEVPANYSDWNSNKEEAVTGLLLSQPTTLKSACGTPEFTNYTNEFSGCLDYIFYQDDRFEVEQSVPLPEIGAITERGGLPNEVFPSDHLALVADLKWK